MEKGAGGYLTVFLSLILSVMISLCLVLVLGARENTRRMELECVTDIGMNNILAEYHRELLRQYDLFFIDTSYGTPYASYENTAAHLQEYLEKNLGGENIFLSVLYGNPLKLKVDDIKITGVSAASDEEGAVLRRQAVDVMYQRVGVSYLEQLQSWLETVQTYELDTRDVLAEHQQAAAALDEWNGTSVTVNGEEKIVEIHNPGDALATLWEAGILNLVVEAPQELSALTIEPESCLSARQLLAGTGMNPDLDFSDSWWEQLFFQEYIMAYTGHYGMEKEDSYFKYQTEYILAGKEKDLENLKSVVYQLLGIRAVANMVYIVSDKEKMQVTEAAAAALAALCTIPQAAPVFQLVIVLTWALVESLIDVGQLLDGKRVPLIKTKEDWCCTLEDAMDFQGDAEQEEGVESGLLYEDYLRILLCLQDKKTMTYRLMDIMEMDIRRTPGNGDFRMDGCIDSVTATIQYLSKDGKSYMITRTYGY